VARPLGYVGDSRAAAPLNRGAGERRGLAIRLIAAVSLGRIKESRAPPALETVVRAYWYPPVRESARKALEVIDGRAAYAAIVQEEDLSFTLQFYAYQIVDGQFRNCLADPNHRGPRVACVGRHAVDGQHRAAALGN